MKIKKRAWFIIFFLIILPALYSLELDDQKMTAFFDEHVPRLITMKHFMSHKF